MIDLLLEQVFDSTRDAELLRNLAAHVATVRASASLGNRQQVAAIEAAIQADPAEAFRFGPHGTASLQCAGSEFEAGRFETPSIEALRRRVLALPRPAAPGCSRLLLLEGDSPATDIGGLQATAGPGTLFQVASQFNCLEAPGPFVTPVTRYFGDPTQGPRASISAFPGTFLRHYAAPDARGGRFVQTTGGLQIDLLEEVCGPDIAQVRSGYLTSSCILQPAAFAQALEAHFEKIRIGLHDDVPVVLGYNWDGEVVGDRRIGQAFTSTYARVGYSSRELDPQALQRICAALLRAAYLGTLLGALACGRRKVMLTLIGGGAFGNPVALIWEALCRSFDEASQLAPDGIDVIVNGREIPEHIARQELLRAVRQRDGVIVAFDRAGASVHR